jgi:hypothetical protein
MRSQALDIDSPNLTPLRRPPASSVAAIASAERTFTQSPTAKREGAPYGMLELFVPPLQRKAPESNPRASRERILSVREWCWTAQSRWQRWAVSGALKKAGKISIWTSPAR